MLRQLSASAPPPSTWPDVYELVSAKRHGKDRNRIILYLRHSAIGSTFSVREELLKETDCLTTRTVHQKQLDRYSISARFTPQIWAQSIHRSTLIRDELCRIIGDPGLRFDDKGFGAASTTLLSRRYRGLAEKFDFVVSSEHGAGLLRVEATGTRCPRPNEQGKVEVWVQTQKLVWACQNPDKPALVGVVFEAGLSGRSSAPEFYWFHPEPSRLAEYQRREQALPTRSGNELMVTFDPEGSEAMTQAEVRDLARRTLGLPDPRCQKS